MLLLLSSINNLKAWGKVFLFTCPKKLEQRPGLTQIVSLKVQKFKFGQTVSNNFIFWGIHARYNSSIFARWSLWTASAGSCSRSPSLCLLLLSGKQWKAKKRFLFLLLLKSFKLISFVSRPSDQEHAYKLASGGYMFSSWYDDLNLNNCPLSTVNKSASCWSYQECDSEWSQWNIMLQRWNYFRSSRWRCCAKDSLRFDRYILLRRVEKMTKHSCWLCEALFWRNDRNHMILNKRWKKLSQA